jgi:transposase
MTSPDARRLSPDAQQDLRRRVIDAVRGGMSVTEAARVFQVTRQSIHNWLNAVEEGGVRALRARKRGPKRGARSLAPHQAASLVRTITAGCPDQLRLPFALWTRQAVIELAARRYGVRLSLSTMGRYLREWGLTPQKPLRRAYERDPAAVRRWLEERYPAIHAHAKRENAEIHWGDEMGLRSDDQAGRSYGRKGVTPVIPGTGQRFGCNMISTVTNRGRLAFMVFTESFTAPVMIRFLKRLTRHVGGAGRRVFLIVDGHPVHKSARVRSWVKAHAAKIELFLLPSYSPDLNPDEFLNQDVKSNALGRRRPRDRREMITDVRGYLRSTQRQPEIVKRYFHAESVRYAA